jgi:Ni/Fe-hydrogenase 1 B-type cytochrome subunit
MTTNATPMDPGATPSVAAGPVVRPLEENLPPTMQRVRIYVWEVPVRVTHWVTFATLIVLTVTGSYIADPFLFAPGQDTMRQVRFVHMIAAFVFVASGIVRTYWLFSGNQFSRWSAFVPTNRRHLRELISQTQFYLFRRRDLPGILGHNALASGTYTVVFFLFLLQTVTGFTLVGLHGTEPWATLFGWVPSVMFGEQGVRLIHHLLMWAIIAFAIHHVYSAVLVDHIERNGLMSSIFTGSKFVARWRVIEARDGGIALDALVRKQDVEESRAEALATALRSEE